MELKEVGIGIKAWCVSKQGLGIETEYISFNRPKVTAVNKLNDLCCLENFQVLGFLTLAKLAQLKSLLLILIH